jgi:hypothetical protein
MADKAKAAVASVILLLVLLQVAVYGTVTAVVIWAVIKLIHKFAA